MANAYDGSLTLPPPPRQARSFFVTNQAVTLCTQPVTLCTQPVTLCNQARSFFVTNRRVCIDWFARIRTHLLRAALYTRAPTSVVRHAQLRMIELAARAAQLCTRAEGSRLVVADGQLKPLLALVS